MESSVPRLEPAARTGEHYKEEGKGTQQEPKEGHGWIERKQESRKNCPAQWSAGMEHVGGQAEEARAEGKSTRLPKQDRDEAAPGDKDANEKGSEQAATRREKGGGETRAAETEADRRGGHRNRGAGATVCAERAEGTQQQRGVRSGTERRRGSEGRRPLDGRKSDVQPRRIADQQGHSERPPRQILTAGKESLRKGQRRTKRANKGGRTEQYSRGNKRRQDKTERVGIKARRRRAKRGDESRDEVAGQSRAQAEDSCRTAGNTDAPGRRTNRAKLG